MAISRFQHDTTRNDPEATVIGMSRPLRKWHIFYRHDLNCLPSGFLQNWQKLKGTPYSPLSSFFYSLLTGSLYRWRWCQVNVVGIEITLHSPFNTVLQDTMHNNGWNSNVLVCNGRTTFAITYLSITNNTSKTIPFQHHVTNDRSDNAVISLMSWNK